MSKMEVADAQRQANTILTELKLLVDDFNSKEESVRRKMAEWPGLLDKLKGLLANVTEANNTAYDAITRGEETLKKAQDMLETLQVGGGKGPKILARIYQTFHELYYYCCC